MSMRNIDIDVLQKRFIQIVSDSRWEELDKAKKDLDSEYVEISQHIAAITFLEYIRGSLDTLNHLIDSM